jgi:hypothetical protein
MAITIQNNTDQINVQGIIVEVRTVRTDEEANKLFSDGWILIHGGASHIDAHGYNAKVHFIMGRIEKGAK